MAALKRSALPELQTTKNREEGEKELLLKPGFGSSLDINCSNVSLTNGKVKKEKKPEKDDIEEITSKFTKKRKNKYALKGEDEERKKANQDIEPHKKEEEMEEHLPFKLKVEENLSFKTKKSVKRKTTNDDACAEYFPLSRNPFVESETNKRENKKKKKKKKREETLEDELVEDKVSEIISRQNPELKKVENKSEVCDEMVLEFKVTKGETHSSLKKKISELSSLCTEGTIEETVIENIEQYANTKQSKAKKRNRNWEEEDILQKSKEEGASENNRKDKNKKKVKYEEMVDSSFFEAQNIQQSLKSSKKKKFEHADIGDQTPKQDTEGMHDVNETIVENIKKCANTDENKAKKKKKKCEGEDGSKENEVKEISESNMKHKKKQKAKNEVIDASLFVEAQNIQQSVKSNKKKKKFRQDKDAMQDDQEAVEVEKKADHEEVLYAPQFGEMGNFHESLKIKIKENSSKSKHSELGYEKQTIKQDTKAILNTEENVDFHGKQGEKKSRKKKNDHVEETNKQGIYDRAVIGLSFDSQQLKRKNTKDRGNYHNEKNFEEVNHVICDVSDKCSKNSDEAKNNESSENPVAQLDKTGSIMNDAKKPKDWLALDFIDFSKSRAFPEEIESMKIRAKRQTKNIRKILSKMNFSKKTLREKPLCFSESLGSPERFNRPSFQCPGKNENVSLDYMDKNMEDMKNRYALQTEDHASDRFSKKGTAVQNTSLGSEQFSKKEIGEKSRPRVLDTEFNKVGSSGRKFDNGDEFLENRKKNLHFGDKRDFDTGNCERNTQHLNVSDGNKRLYSSHAERSVRGTGPNRSHNMKSSCRGTRKFPKKEFHDYFKDEKQLYSAARAFKGANIWKCIGYKI